jgi:amidohydrolase
MRKLLMMPALLIAGAALTQSALTATIQQQASNLQPKLVEWRRHIHQNPELGNREFKTMEYVAAHLRQLGLEVKTGVGKTGVVGILKGGKPGPVVALRADMDALPVKERVDIPFKSTATAEYLGQTVPVMHACGHDSHVSILMGTAQALANMKKDVPGTVVFIFQPAEEGPPGDEEGGAPLMIKEGVLDNPKVEAIFGLHINSLTPIGEIKYKSGSTMASSDWFTVKVKGKQTHGSQPWSGVDPIMVSAAIIDGFQTIVSREMELTKAPVVITVGKINAGVRSNIIPEEATMDGTIRTLDPGMQKAVHERMKNMASTIAAAHGATAEVTIDTKTLVTVNNPVLTEKMVPSLVKAAGAANVKVSDWTTGAEDFSYFSDKVPGLFFFLGGMPKGKNPKEAAPHHTPDFYIDDSMLDVGVKAFCHLVMDYAALGAAKK